ncbi:hypothetical protein LCGC14_0398880 [marine sediment metagenome]|uniref:Uncharacterized protein n=1 Tax=marine sediment metagenome TaxID=412755 RepID=A0A0F9TFF8_9ZZZZ|nr:hypothetical protein [Candidatus Aminicenantes bacterium]
MICEQCGGEMEKGKSWDFKGKTFNREVCSQCGWKAKAFLVKSGDETPSGGGMKMGKPKEKVNWDKISEGKVRHHFALEAFKMGKPLNEGLVIEIDCWVNYVMTGKLE